MMDPALLTAITSALGVVAAIAPGVLAAATGKPSDADAIAACLAAARGVPELEASAGDDTAGAWDADLAERKRAGLAPTAPPATPYEPEP